MVNADSTVCHFLHLADNIRAKQAPVRTTPKCIITWWILVGVITVLLAPFVEYCLHGFLAAYGLGWVLFMGMAGVGALGILLVVMTVADARTNLALEANLTEIQTLLKFSIVLLKQS